MASGCAVCSRNTVVFLCTVITVIALVVIALTLWIRFDNNFESGIRSSLLNTTPNPADLYNVKQAIRTAITICFWVLIGMGAATAIVGLMGIGGSIGQSRGMIILFSLLMIILIGLEIAIGVFIWVYRPQIQNLTSQYSSLAFQYNTADAQALMNRYQCCGDGTANPMNQQCAQYGYTIDCPTAVWSRLNFTLMIAGIILLGIIIGEALTVLFGFCFGCSSGAAD